MSVQKFVAVRERSSKNYVQAKGANYSYGERVVLKTKGNSLIKRLTWVASAAILIVGCAPVNPEFSSVAISPRSPFFNDRVIINDADLQGEFIQNGEAVQGKALNLERAEKLQQTEQDEQTSKKQIVPSGTELAVVISNACAIRNCEASVVGSLTCEIYKEKMIPELMHEVQVYEWTLTEDTFVPDIRRRISEDPVDSACVVGVSLNKVYKASQTTPMTFNDPGAEAQYYHETIGGPGVYKFFKDANLSRVRVGILDTGIEYQHEDLQSTGAYSWYLRAATSCDKICNAHGTFVAGIVAAGQNNSKGGYGIAPNAITYGVQLGNASGTFSTIQLANAMQFLLTVSNPEIINMSLGGPNTRDVVFENAMTSAMDKDVLIVVSAGNDSKDLAVNPTYPANFNFPGQITVGSASPRGVDHQANMPLTPGADKTIVRDAFSNFGSGIVHIAAPGRGIYSPMLSNTYGIWNGTSFSAPMVTGAAVLALGYLKAKGIPYSSLTLKQLVLEGSRREDSMNEMVSGVERRPFNGNRFLDLSKLKEGVVRYANQMASAPARISIISSETVGSGTAKQVKMRVEVNDADPAAGLTLTLHTNKSFLDESKVHSCQITLERTFCDITVAFSQMYIDPGPFYLAVRDASGAIVNELTFEKDSLNFGNRAESPLLGEIHLVKYLTSRYQVEGWACLKGFPDKVDIEVRYYSNTGSPIATFPTSVQARGRYFDACQAAEVTFGFSWIPPAVYAQMGGEFFFRAVHKGTGKTLDLPVVSYFPGYQDTKPIEFAKSVFLDKNIYEEEPELKITKRTMKDWTLELEGSICFKNSKKPASFALGLTAANLSQLVPDAAMKSGFGLANLRDGGGSMAASFSSGGRTAIFKNSKAKSPDNAGELLTWNDQFSEIHIGRPLVLAPIGPSQKYRYPKDVPKENPATDKVWKNFIMIDDDVFADGFGTGTIHPNINLNDGCAFPSGFKVSIPMKNRIESIVFSLGYTFNLDHFGSLENFLDSVDLGKELSLLKSVNESDFEGLIDELTFDPVSFGVVLKTLLGRASHSITSSRSGFDYQVLFSLGQATAAGGWISSTNKSYNRWRSEWSWAVAHGDSIVEDYQPSLPRWKSYVDSRTISPGYDDGYQNSVYQNDHDVDPKLPIWNQKLDLNLQASENMNLMQVYMSPVIQLPKMQLGKLLTQLYHERMLPDLKFGELGLDFKLEVKINGSGAWIEIPVEPGVLGYLSNQAVLPLNATSLQFRILANGRNKFKIWSFSMAVE